MEIYFNRSFRNKYFSIQISFLVMLLFLFTCLAEARQNESLTGSGKEIVLRYADSLMGEVIDGEMVRKYSGRVSFKQGNVNVNCDNAIHYIERNDVRLFGKVVITQEGLVMKAPLVNYYGNSGIADARLGVRIEHNNARLNADSGTYSTNTKIADFHNNVIFEDDSVIITCKRMKYLKEDNISIAYEDVVVDDDSAIVFCDILEYYRSSGDSKAYGNVRINGKFDKIILIGDTIINLSSKNFTEASGSPLLFQIDSTRRINDNEEEYFVYDTLSISSDTMRVFKNEGKEFYHFIGSVELRKGGIAAKSGFGDYNKSDAYFRLDIEPIAWYDSTQLHSDTIIVYLPDNKLREIVATGSAFAALKDDSSNTNRINQISGGEIRILFERDSIAAIKGFGNAKSLYYMVSEKGNDGAARNSADSIFIQFSEGQADEILWMGAVQGEYFPEIIIYQEPKSYYLPGYRWSDAIPIKRCIPINRNEQKSERLIKPESPIKTQ